jgi:hypothetical protein
MSQYRLKDTSHDFEMVDGPFEGRKYRSGQQYEEADIPSEKKGMFEPVILTSAPADSPSGRKGRGFDASGFQAASEATADKKDEGGKDK